MMKAKIGEKKVNGHVVAYGKFNEFFDGPLVWFMSENNEEYVLHPSSLKETVEDEESVKPEHFAA